MWCWSTGIISVCRGLLVTGIISELAKLFSSWLLSVDLGLHQLWFMREPSQLCSLRLCSISLWIPAFRSFIVYAKLHPLGSSDFCVRHISASLNTFSSGLRGTWIVRVNQKLCSSGIIFFSPRIYNRGIDFVLEVLYTTWLSSVFL